MLDGVTSVLARAPELGRATDNSVVRAMTTYGFIVYYTQPDDNTIQLESIVSTGD